MSRAFQSRIGYTKIMNKFMAAIVLVLSFVVLPETSFAASYVTARVTSITALAGYDIAYIVIDNDFAGNVVCGTTTRRAVLAGPSPGMERIYSLLLAAKVSGQTVRLTAVGCGEIYGVSAPAIWAAELMN